MEVVRKVDSYAEFSPSGAGLHIICRSDMTGDGRKVGRVEVYPRGRYFTVTGDHVSGTPETIRFVPVTVLEKLVEASTRANGPDGGTGRADGLDGLPA